MGYQTYFDGEVTVTPPLNEHEVAYLNKFADSRRMRRTKGPYYAEPGDNFGQSDEPDIVDANQPPQGQPGLWCHWIPTDDGTMITWDQGEKFYDSAEWMSYLIDTFLMPGAAAQGQMQLGWVRPPEFDHFTFDHQVNGEIDATGEDPNDRWRLVVRNNVVSVQYGEVIYGADVVVSPEGPDPIQATAERTDRPQTGPPAITAGQFALPAAEDVIDAQVVD